MTTTGSRRELSEGAIVVLVAAVQFVNIIDFMMVMPMGPDFAKALGIPVSHLGLVGGSYTAAAAVSGLVCSLFLDRFDRRLALAITMLGLVGATAAGGIAGGLATLLAARMAAGAFGGPAASLCMSIIADVIPPERRGKAMGVVMSSFAVASVLGVPAGLELARLAGWRAPFFAVALMGLVVAGMALWMMPPMRRHLEAAPRAIDLPPVRATFARSGVALSLTAAMLSTVSAFVLVPNLSAYLQYNCGYPRDRLGSLYLVGGFASFAAMQLVGSWVDRFGAPRVSAFGTAAFAVILYLGFVWPPNTVAPMTLFVTWMLSSALRNVPLQTVSSRVPLLVERARYMSVQSSVTHVGAAAGAILSTLFLRQLEGGKLDGMAGAALFAIAIGLLHPVLLVVVERQLRARGA